MTDDMLAHYSAALDEIHRLRTALAYEAQVTQVHLSYVTFPKTQRAHAEAQVERMKDAAAGWAEAAYAHIGHLSLNHARNEAGVGPLTRGSWEARELNDRNRHLRNTNPVF